jgi:hypothetical protein
MNMMPRDTGMEHDDTESKPRTRGRLSVLGGRGRGSGGSGSRRGRGSGSWRGSWRHFFWCLLFLLRRGRQKRRKHHSFAPCLHLARILLVLRGSRRSRLILRNPVLSAATSPTSTPTSTSTSTPTPPTSPRVGNIPLQSCTRSAKHFASRGCTHFASMSFSQAQPPKRVCA